MKMTTKEKMLKALVANRGRIAFTVPQAKRRFGITGVPQRIFELRKDGYKIETVTQRNKVGYQLSAQRRAA